MNAHDLADRVDPLLLEGETIETLEITDDLSAAEIRLTVRYLEREEAREDDVTVRSMNVEDAAARLLAYLERRHE